MTMNIFNIITLIITALGWAFTYGKTIQKISQFEKEIEELKEAVKERPDRCDKHFVTKETNNAFQNEVFRGLSDIDSIDLRGRLARIEAMLDQLIKEKS